MKNKSKNKGGLLYEYPFKKDKIIGFVISIIGMLFLIMGVVAIYFWDLYLKIIIGILELVLLYLFLDYLKKLLNGKLRICFQGIESNYIPKYDYHFDEIVDIRLDYKDHIEIGYRQSHIKLTLKDGDVEKIGQRIKKDDLKEVYNKLKKAWEAYREGISLEETESQDYSPPGKRG